MATRIKGNINDLADIAEQLREYADSLEEKAKQLCEDLADTAYDVVEDAYNSYTGKDTYVWVTDPAPTKDGYMVEATGGKAYGKGGAVGNMVLFVEFGSGDAADTHPQADEFGVYPGSFSQTVGAGHYKSQGDTWEYDGEILHEIPATMGMYNGAQEARRQIVPTAKDVFGGG